MQGVYVARAALAAAIDESRLEAALGDAGRS
jgi:hypothetical protein